MTKTFQFLWKTHPRSLISGRINSYQDIESKHWKKRKMRNLKNSKRKTTYKGTLIRLIAKFLSEQRGQRQLDNIIEVPMTSNSMSGRKQL